MVVAKPGSITPHSRHTVKRRGETPSLKHRH
jgi:hypothetical protein